MGMKEVELKDILSKRSGISLATVFLLWKMSVAHKEIALYLAGMMTGVAVAYMVLDFIKYLKKGKSNASVQ